MIMIDENTSRIDLEAAIISEDSLYNLFNEQRLLDGQYSDDELRNVIIGWIESDPDTVVL